MKAFPDSSDGTSSQNDQDRNKNSGDSEEGVAQLKRGLVSGSRSRETALVTPHFTSRLGFPQSGETRVTQTVTPRSLFLEFHEPWDAIHNANDANITLCLIHEALV